MYISNTYWYSSNKLYGYVVHVHYIANVIVYESTGEISAQAEHPPLTSDGYMSRKNEKKA